MRANRRSHGPDREVSGSANTCTLVAAKPGGRVKVGTGVGLLAGADVDIGRGFSVRADSFFGVLDGLGLTGSVIRGSGSGDGGPRGVGVAGVGVGVGESDGVGEEASDGESVGVGEGEGDGFGVSEGVSTMLCKPKPESLVDRGGAVVRANAAGSEAVDVGMADGVGVAVG